VRNLPVAKTHILGRRGVRYVNTSVSEKHASFIVTYILNLEATWSSETSVSIYKTTWF